MDICPCKKCSDRHAGCHGRCSAYKNWRDSMDEVRDKKNEDWQLRDYFTKPRHRSRREVKR